MRSASKQNRVLTHPGTINFLNLRIFPRRRAAQRAIKVMRGLVVERDKNAQTARARRGAKADAKEFIFDLLTFASSFAPSRFRGLFGRGRRLRAGGLDAFGSIL